MPTDQVKGVVQRLLPQRLITTLAGCLAACRVVVIKNFLIRHFIRLYNVNMAEAIKENYTDYTDFNDFFVRHLKPSCRPIADATLVSPVDGSISEIGSVDNGALIQAKGHLYSLNELLAGSQVWIDRFQHGLFATIYLSPKDYHRIHMPIDATPQEMIYIPGKLFSVQPATTRTIPRLFARNERVVVFFDTPLGYMAMILVGAVVVGAMGISWHGEFKRSKKRAHFSYDGKPAIELQKGEEMGYFKLGSTVILLFSNAEQLEWVKTLKAGDNIMLGSPLATFKN